MRRKGSNLGRIHLKVYGGSPDSDLSCPLSGFCFQRIRRFGSIRSLAEIVVAALTANEIDGRQSLGSVRMRTSVDSTKEGDGDENER